MSPQNTQPLDYTDLSNLYNKYFSIGFLGADINNKFALISLVCYITYKVRRKDPDWTCWNTLYKINKGSDDFIKRLAIICEDYLYGCSEFPTFGLEDKQIPTKIKELLDNSLPF